MTQVISLLFMRIFSFQKDPFRFIC